MSRKNQNARHARAVPALSPTLLADLNKPAAVQTQPAPEPADAGWDPIHSPKCPKCGLPIGECSFFTRIGMGHL